MPCLRLTLPQLARLFGMTHEVCARVLGTLVREGTLRQDPDGRYGTRVNH
jgi:DNA-binding IclR family transcriptional regulator